MLTGGPEALHQLSHAIKMHGHDPRMLYFPFNKYFTVPVVYRQYDAVIGDYIREKMKGEVVILPETCPHFHQLFPDSIKMLWWLSVDGYFKCNPQTDYDWLVTQPENLFDRDYLKQNFQGHLAQSFYARNFLAENGLNSLMVTDYLNPFHLNADSGNEDRENLIAFNPRKGFEITSALVQNAQRLNFVSIEGMPRETVRQTLLKCKAYIDFGTHPGKDRLPREAAMAGCCIVTGLQGSAANDIDVPIPPQYKLDANSPDFLNMFLNVISRIFDDFTGATADFEAYRRLIREEPQVFLNEVGQFIDALDEYAAV